MPPYINIIDHHWYCPNCRTKIGEEYVECPLCQYLRADKPLKVKLDRLSKEINKFRLSTIFSLKAKARSSARPMKPPRGMHIIDPNRQHPERWNKKII
jgi:hypothetical protein